MGSERLQKILAHAGVASRRKAEDLIRAGRVAVNGEVVRELGAKATPGVDEIHVDGEPIVPETLEHWALNKPLGVVSTVDDPGGRPTVRGLVPTKARVYPVGRLDMDSTGLLLLSNDGALAQRLLHPRHEIPKRYRILVSGYPNRSDLDRVRGGLELDDGPTAPARVWERKTTGDGAWLEVELREGRKRQLRRMMEAVGHPVVHLQRIAIGPLKLGRMKEGEARRLSKREVDALRRAAAGKGPTRQAGRGRPRKGRGRR